MPTESFRAFAAPPRDVTTLTLDDLPGDGALVEVAWSSVNYKDALAASPNGRVARISPIVPGIDLAGRLVERAGDLPAGAEVLAHGYDIGVSRHGGFAQYARVPAEWLVPLPSGLDLREAMVIGTAGFTAALSVVALEEHGLTPGDGPVLVTGATGGVGSVAVSILARRGYEVAASTGKAAAAGFLRGLGASDVIDRETLSQPGKPLETMVWAGAVDCVGGVTLATVLARTRYGGAVAASGLTGGAELPTTVMPFILRGVSLLGIDSVQTAIERRRAVWSRLGTDLKPGGLDEIAHEVGLGDLDGALSAILQGGMTGRSIVDVQR
ncbi:MAG TPA: acryloyl-CoA reductase [Acidimicrobiales bacterium]|nr:acryloyl-CoA reductase [Acidimicrobiales bacterium]